MNEEQLTELKAKLYKENISFNQSQIGVLIVTLEFAKVSTPKNDQEIGGNKMIDKTLEMIARLIND